MNKALNYILLLKIFSHHHQWRIQGRCQGHAHSRSKFFHFHAILRQNICKISFGAPISGVGTSLDPSSAGGRSPCEQTATCKNIALPQHSFAGVKITVSRKKAKFILLSRQPDIYHDGSSDDVVVAGWVQRDHGIGQGCGHSSIHFLHVTQVSNMSAVEGSKIYHHKKCVFVNRNFVIISDFSNKSGNIFIFLKLCISGI